MEKDNSSIFPIRIGKKGVNDYFLLYATGEKIPFPTEEEIAKINEEFPEINPADIPTE